MQIRVVLGGALRLVLGKNELILDLREGTVQEVVDALAAGSDGARPLGLEQCLVVAKNKVVPAATWRLTRLELGETVTVYPPLAGGRSPALPDDSSSADG